MIAWTLRERPEASDRCVAGQTGVNHRTVAGVRKQMEAGGEILHLPPLPAKYPAAAKPTVYAASSSEGRRAVPAGQPWRRCPAPPGEYPGSPQAPQPQGAVGAEILPRSETPAIYQD